MGKRIVEFDPRLIQELITQDHVIGDGRVTRTIEGVPVGAKIVACWVNQDRSPNSVFVILFEHEDWSETPQGEPYKPFMPVFRAELLP